MDERAGPGGDPSGEGLGRPEWHVVDVVLGGAAETVVAAGIVTRPLTAVVRPVARVMLRPPMIPAALHPATWLDAAARRGAALRGAAAHELADRLDAALPVIASTLDGHADLTEIVQGHVDLVSVAQDLVTEIDLPEIIRSSTGAIASDTVLGVRMQSMSADDALGRAADRLRARLTRRAHLPPRSS